MLSDVIIGAHNRSDRDMDRKTVLGKIAHVGTGLGVSGMIAIDEGKQNHGGDEDLFTSSHIF